jgi:flagellar biosynthesis protein FlhF
MRIKKFEAFEMSEALRAVRKEMGPDAVILSTREFRKNGGVFGLLGRPMVEVTAAMEPPDPEGRRTGKAPGDFGAVLEEIRRAGASDGATPSIQGELNAIKEAIEALRAPGPGQGARGLLQLQETCAEMQEMLKTLTEHAHRQRREREIAGAHPTLIALFDDLISNGVDPEAAMGLFDVMKRKLSEDDLWKEDFARRYLKDLIQKKAPAPPPTSKDPKGLEIIALVGPTGVGKTTTLAKLAANQFKRKVTLATLDTYRVGAVEQLKNYAKIIGVPVEVAFSGRELRERLARRKEGLVLIDTAGRSHLNASQVDELKELGKMGLPVETHLVLSSNTKEADLNDIIDGFSVIPIHYLLFTKMDETRTYGLLFNAIRKKGKPVSYLTMGQRVPEDIERATPKRLTDLVLN